jgi:hypothetical protein
MALSVTSSSASAELLSFFSLAFRGLGKKEKKRRGKKAGSLANPLPKPNKDLYRGFSGIHKAQWRKQKIRIFLFRIGGVCKRPRSTTGGDTRPKEEPNCVIVSFFRVLFF